MSRFDWYRSIVLGANVVVYPGAVDGLGGGIPPAVVRQVWNTLMERLRSAGWDRAARRKLAEVSVEVEPGAALATRASADGIVVSDGHLRAGLVFAYASARLESDRRLERCYIEWFDYLVDALLQGDPIVHLDDGFPTLRRTLASGLAPSGSPVEVFKQTSYGWVAHLLAHEAAHIALDHGRRFEEEHRDLPADPANWREDVYATSRAFELEADAKGIEVLQAARLLSSRVVAVWLQWLCVRSAVMAALGGPTSSASSTTHPSALERSGHLLEVLVDLGAMAAGDLEVTTDFLQRLVEKYERALRAGTLRELPRLGGRPPSIRVAEERVAKRVMSLALCVKRASARGQA